MKKKIVSISLLASALLTNASEIELSQMSVTATGIEEKVIDQPLSIAKKDESEIKLDQIIFQKDLLNSLSGVRIEQTSSVIGHMTSIRMPKNTGPYYLFMQDNLPVQSSGFFNHNGLAYTTFQSASSVEVLKGAGTALYGSDAVAAVINVKSLKAPSKEKEVIFKGMGGSYGYASGSVEASDMIDKDSAYRANVSYMHSDGWRQHTKADRLEANVRYDLTLDDENDIKLIINASKTDADQADSFNDYTNIENGSTAASDDPKYFTALELTDVKRKFDYTRVSLEWNNYSVDGLEIKTTPYVRYNRNQYVATWENNLPSNDTKLYTAGLNNRNTYDIKWGKVIFGFDSEFTKSSLQYNQDFDLTTTGWGANTYVAGPLYDYNVNYIALAPYANVDYHISKKVLLRAGLRYDYNKFDYTNNLADNSTDASNTYFRAADRSDSFSHLSPKLSLAYKINSQNNIYARYANGFRIPQASTLYSMKVGYESVTLEPEESNTYEIGYKRLFSEKGFFELAVYYMTIDDTITRYQSGSVRYYDNGGTTIHKGIETTLDYKLSDEVETHLAYSYSKHYYGNNPTYGSNEMQEAPNHLANARVIYAPAALKGLRIMPEWQYVGSYWMDDAHTVDKYKGYSIGNLKADYAYNKKVRVFAKVTNITDKKYAVSARYAYGKTDYTPGDPRSFYAGLEYKW